MVIAVLFQLELLWSYDGFLDDIVNDIKKGNEIIVY